MPFNILLQCNRCSNNHVLKFSHAHTNLFKFLQAKLRADQRLSTPLNIGNNSSFIFLIHCAS